MHSDTHILSSQPTPEFYCHVPFVHYLHSTIIMDYLIVNYSDLTSYLTPIYSIKLLMFFFFAPQILIKPRTIYLSYEIETTVNWYNNQKLIWTLTSCTILVFLQGSIHWFSYNKFGRLKIKNGLGLKKNHFGGPFDAGSAMYFTKFKDFI